MDKNKAHPRSRNPLVEKQSQLYLSLTVVLYMVIYTILLIIIITTPSILKFTRQSIPLSEQFEASREFLFLDQRVVPGILVIMVVVGFHFLFITHRIFGPLLRFRKMLHSWGEGSWPYQFKNRPKDFHGELFDTFNDTAGKLGEDVQAVQGLLGETMEIIEKTPREAIPEDSVSRLSEAADKCRKALDKIGRYTFSS
jgi:methyl-accepting chemotaxis protein